MYSDWDCTLEDLPDPPAVRLGLRLIDGFKEASAVRIMAEQAKGPFDDPEDLAHRAKLEQHEMQLLAGADALRSLSGHRRQQVWQASALRRAPKLLQGAPVDEDFLELPLKAKRSSTTTTPSVSRCAAIRCCCCGPSSKSTAWPEPRTLTGYVQGRWLVTPASSRSVSSPRQPRGRCSSRSRMRPAMCKSSSGLTSRSGTALKCCVQSCLRCMGDGNARAM